MIMLFETAFVGFFIGYRIYFAEIFRDKRNIGIQFRMFKRRIIPAVVFAYGIDIRNQQFFPGMSFS